MVVVRRAVLLLFAIAFQAVPVARLALHVREAGLEPHIEAKHGSSCAAGHDHSLCVLICSAPWLDAPPPPHTEPFGASILDAPRGTAALLSKPQVCLTLARAPPSQLPLT